MKQYHHKLNIVELNLLINIILFTHIILINVNNLNLSIPTNASSVSKYI